MENRKIVVGTDEAIGIAVCGKDCVFTEIYDERICFSMIWFISGAIAGFMIDIVQGEIFGKIFQNIYFSEWQRVVCFFVGYIYKI